MKLDMRKKVRDVAGEHIFIMQGKEATDMTRVVALNETALFLYKKLMGRDFEQEDVVKLMLEEFEVDEATACVDAAKWLQEMRDESLIID